MEIKRKTMTRFIIVLIFLSGIIFYACKKQEAEKQLHTERPANVFYVRTSPIAVTGMQDIIHVTGILQSDTEAKPSFKTGGVIARTYVKEGDAVRQGQLLAKLNLTEIEAQATQAQYALEKAQRDLQRVKNLYADSIATLEQMQNASTGVDMAKKTLQIAQFNLSTSETRSPINGKVVKQFLNEGEVTGPGTPVYYIMGVQSSDWKLVAGLTDKDYGRVRKGDNVKIKLDAYPGWTIDGKVQRLSDAANPASGTFDAEISIPSKDNRIAAGMMANVEITPTTSGEFPIIPIEALVSSNGKTGIVFIPKDGVAEKRLIHIQQFHGERIAVQSGLEGATEVITAGSGFLEDGDLISIEKDSSAPKSPKGDLQLSLPIK